MSTASGESAPAAHRSYAPESVSALVLTVSDSRDAESDSSGQLIQQSLEAAGHHVAGRVIVPDEAPAIREQVLRAIRTKRLHGGAFTPTDLQDRYADVNIYGLPFLFESAAEVDYVREQMDDTLLQGLEEAGFISFGFTNGGFAYLMSNEPVRGLDDLKGKRVWVPEGDTISYAAMDALELSPVTLPITDVMTGLQTGLIDIVAFPPSGTLALQWHTRVKYVTEMPILFSMGLMAIDAKAFGRLPEQDQRIVREVMGAMYAEFSRREPEENRNAKEALLNSGVQSVMPDEGEVEKIRKVMEKTNRELGAKGMFSLKLYDEMVRHIEDYRNQQADAAGAD